MTTSAEREVPPPSMKDLLAACAAATAVSTPPPSEDEDKGEGDGTPAAPEPRSGSDLPGPREA
ncbi:hypothetical protein OH786_13270 [Streptomyces atratus]|uniref:Uncharacterized protein n=1 Tax=Streptomyces atratus TaxID=1893 RepID=A0A1K2CTH4_STRAR|nr:hypothetical protein [Streptomyces atratus]SFY14327.1 hypothetical protein SAMN02787144_1011225 [Streptomyces atratus]